MTMRAIKPEPLSAEAFAPYGDVIDFSDNPLSINDGLTERFHDLAALDLLADGGKPTLSLFRTKPLPRPLIIRAMERHPLSSQAFYPLGAEPYLVVVAEKGHFDPKNIKVFLAQSSQGVNYHKGIWHHYSLALNAVSDFLVIDRGGKQGDNCDEVRLSEREQIIISI